MLEPYYTVIIPFEPNPSKRTVWHPDCLVGPFSVLSRGVFLSHKDAIQWAKDNLGNSSFSIRKIDPNDRTRL